jgi:hydrogenase maturation protease
MIQNAASTLLIGIGNSGRQDDGLGWAFLDAIQAWGQFRGDLTYRYQMQVEDAELVSQYEQVVFVDAHHGALPGGFAWQTCVPSEDFEFTTHVLPPQAVLYLCKDLYGKTPQGSVLLLEGTEWELRIGLTERGKEILAEAFATFQEKLTNASIESDR